MKNLIFGVALLALVACGSSLEELKERGFFMVIDNVEIVEGIADNAEAVESEKEIIETIVRLSE